MGTPKQQQTINLIPPSSDESLLDAHLRYARLGIATIPILKGEKHSGIPEWEQLGYPDEAQIRRWHNSGKYGGFGVRPGKLGQNLVWFDCDGEAAYAAVCQAFPLFNNTYTERTGSGTGYRMALQVARLPDSIALKTSKITRKGILGTDALGFEIFFESGQVIVAPSGHPSGGRYAVEKALPVLAVNHIDDIVTWALSLETKADREAKKRYQQVNSGQSVGQGKTPADVIAAIENALGISQYKRNGWSKDRACIFANHEHDSDKPRSGWNKEKHIYQCHKCGRIWLAKETAAQLGIAWPEKPAKKSTIVRTNVSPAPAIQADLVLNERYVSNRLGDLPTSGVIAIISGTGTGKTELSQRAVAEHESALTITPLRMLTRNAAERNGDEYYENVPGNVRSLLSRLSITLKSIEQFGELAADQFPRYDVLRLDELSKMLEQLGSELFKDGQAARTFAVLKQLIKYARRVYVTDAYMGQIEIDFLKSIRPDVFTVVNTYQHHYCDLVMYPTYEPLLGAMEKAIPANKGTVAIQSNRQSEVEKLAEYFGAIYGRDQVMSIHSGNSTNVLQRTFLTTVTGRDPEAAAAALAQYRVVIASPSILTGVDIQPHVYRLFGVFYSQHGDQIDAAGCAQMLARYRCPVEAHVWVGQGERNLTTSAQTIYNDYREAARNTAILCNLSEDGLDFDGINQELLRLQSELIARRNRSLNALYADFVNLVQHNYTIRGVQADLPAGNVNGVFEAHEAVQARLKEMTLDPALEAITPEMHQDRSKRGIRTDQDNAAVLKYLIQRTYRQPITEQLYDRYDDGKGAAEIKTYIDVLHTPEKELKARDTRQLVEGESYIALKHLTARARTIRRLYLAVWGNRKHFTPDHTLTLEHIETVVSAFMSESARDLALYCGQRADYSDKPVNVLKHIMRLMGLALRKDREPATEGAAATYRLEAESHDLMASLAKIRMEAIEQEEIARKSENQKTRFYGENLQKSVVYRDKPGFLQNEKEPQQVFPAWTPPQNSDGASRSNPFSKKAIA